MPTFNEFVQSELPLRPSVSTDGAAGQMLVRSNNPVAVRELIWADVPAGTGGGSSLVLLAGEAVSGHRVMTTNSAGEAVYADASNATLVAGAIGISTNAAALAGVVTIQLNGQVTEPSWSWVPNLPIYITGMGQLSQTPPSTGMSMQIAVPTSATSVIVAIKMPIFLI